MTYSTSIGDTLEVLTTQVGGKVAEFYSIVSAETKRLVKTNYAYTLRKKGSSMVL